MFNRFVFLQTPAKVALLWPRNASALVQIFLRWNKISEYMPNIIMSVACDTCDTSGFKYNNKRQNFKRSRDSLLFYLMLYILMLVKPIHLLHSTEQ